MVFPNNKLKLNPIQLIDRINVIIEIGRNLEKFLVLGSLKIRNAPSALKTRPSSSGRWDNDTRPSIPNKSCDKESA